MSKAIGYCRFQSPWIRIDLKSSKHIFCHTAFLTALLFIQISNTKVNRYGTNSGNVNIGSKRGKENGSEIFQE